MAFVLLLLALPLGTWSQSVTNCGAAGDHLQNVNIKISPDPIQKGTSFTVDFSGNLDTVVSAMNADIDLNVKALGIISEPVKLSSPLSVSPGIPAGQITMSVGPLTMPSLPGSLEADGTIKITNDKNEPVACINLALKIGGTEVAAAKNEVAASAQGSNVSVCSQASDHLHNLVISDSAGVSTITGSLDEAVTKLSVNVDLKVKVSILSIPISLAIPISYTPGLPKGDVKVTLGPSSGLLSTTKSLIDVDVTGTVKANDEASEEIMCLSLTPAEKNAGLITV